MKQWLKIEKIPGLLASSYEKATRMVIGSYYVPLAEKIVSHMTDGKILDLGTGPGYLPIEMVKRSSSLQIVGIDLSRRLIQMARINARKAGVTGRLNFQVGNAARLSFDDSIFDMVISTGMLHALKDPVRVLREIYRVLKAGGEAWIYDPAKVASHIDRRKWKAALTFRERFFLWWFTLIGLHKPIETYTRAQVAAMIEATDFSDYSIEDAGDEIIIKLRK